jgi:GWxTD domain-containing protein
MRPLLAMTQVKPFSDVARMMGSVASLRIPIPISSMVPGRYQLDVVREDGTDTISATFRVYWEQMPLSLRNLDYAIELMRYIMTDEEHDEIDGGPASDRRFKLMEYWRMHDPTPATTFNEHLQEYFRRVDQAFYAFSTLQEPDGAIAARCTSCTARQRRPRNDWISNAPSRSGPTPTPSVRPSRSRSMRRGSIG